MNRAAPRRPLDAVVTTEIRTVTIRIVFAIDFVVAMLVADQIGKREAVVAGYQVNGLFMEYHQKACMDRGTDILHIVFC